jgi:predicted transglutaminase-like cysteine proteinase
MDIYFHNPMTKEEQEFLKKFNQQVTKTVKKMQLNSIYGKNYKEGMYTDTDIASMRFKKVQELLATFIEKDDLQWHMVYETMGLDDLKELSKLNDKIAALRKELNI